MKNIRWVLIIAFSLLALACGKDEDDNFVDTIVEGQLINRQTQEPIIGETMEIRGVIGFFDSYNKYESDITNEDGTFRIEFLGPEHGYLNFRILPTHRELYFKDIHVNGEMDLDFLYAGIVVEAGRSHFFEIEVIPKP